MFTKFWVITFSSPTGSGVYYYTFVTKSRHSWAVTASFHSVLSYRTAVARTVYAKKLSYRPNLEKHS